MCDSNTNYFITPCTSDKAIVIINYASNYSSRYEAPKRVVRKCKEHLCDICGNTFQRPSHVLRHKKVIHKVDVPLPIKAVGKYGCRVCNKKFSSANSRWRHEKILHKFKPQFKHKFNCANCENVCGSKKELLDHISEAHPEVNQSQELRFNSVSSFKSWKSQVEKDTVSSYVLTKVYETKTASIKLYSCHRSGNFKSRGKGIRRIKLVGTNKIGSFCPANIRAEFSKLSDSVSVKYFPTHLGHDFEVERLRLSETEKEKIAGSLYAGVPIPTILSSIAESSSPSKRLANAKWQDIKNIATSYGLDISKDKKYISKEKSQSEALTQLKETVSKFIDYIPEVEGSTHEEESKELIKILSIAKHKHESDKTYPSEASTSFVENIQQRNYSKKNKVKLEDNETLDIILCENSVTIDSADDSSVPIENHNYSYEITYKN